MWFALGFVTGALSCFLVGFGLVYLVVIRSIALGRGKP